MRGARILVVEDESPIAQDLRICLENLGYEVVATTGKAEEAISMTAEQRPDLVLMDILLRGKMDGITAADHIRVNYNIPVVYVTAHIDEETLGRAKITEPFGYIIKPFADKELHSVIEMALYKHAMDTKLLEREQWLHKTLNSIGEAVLTTDMSGRITFMNQAAESLVGWTNKEALQKNVSHVCKIVDSDKDKNESPVLQVICDGAAIKRTNSAMVVTKQDRQIPIDYFANPIMNDKGADMGVVLVLQDVSERRKAEIELKKSRQALRSLTAHIQTARENERTQVAREIHDELGQALTAIKIDLSRLPKKIGSKRQDVLEAIAPMIAIIDSTIATVQRISADLRPGILDDLGLTAAVSWQAEEFQKRTGIKCTFDSGSEDYDLDPERRTAIFRVYQEALTNVARHSQATQVETQMKEKSGRLVLTVQDNGLGIEKSKISDLKSLGLVGMRERVHPWNGRFRISGQAGKGTKVEVIMPMNGGKTESKTNGFDG